MVSFYPKRTNIICKLDSPYNLQNEEIQTLLKYNFEHKIVILVCYLSLFLSHFVFLKLLFNRNNFNLFLVRIKFTK